MTAHAPNGGDWIEKRFQMLSDEIQSLREDNDSLRSKLDRALKRIQSLEERKLCSDETSSSSETSSEISAQIIRELSDRVSQIARDVAVMKHTNTRLDEVTQGQQRLETETTELKKQVEQLKSNKIISQPSTKSPTPKQPVPTPKVEPQPSNNKVLTIPQGTLEIRPGMFQDTTYEVVVIPDSVTSISNNAFRDWTNLKEVCFGQRSQLNAIGIGAFQNSGITSFIAPPGLRTIAQAAFCGCRNLKFVVLNEGLETLGTKQKCSPTHFIYGVFQNSGLEKITLPSTLKNILSSAFYGCEHLKNINLPIGLENIYNRAFQGSGITKIAIPASVMSIGNSSFLRCQQLSSITFAPGCALKTFGNNVFDDTPLSTRQIQVPMQQDDMFSYAQRNNPTGFDYDYE